MNATGSAPLTCVLYKTVQHDLSRRQRRAGFGEGNEETALHRRMVPWDAMHPGTGGQRRHPNPPRIILYPLN